MRGRYEEKSTQNKLSFISQINNHKFKYSHFDLCFSYSKSKPKQTKLFSPAVTPSQSNLVQRSYDNPKFRLSCRLGHKKQSFRDTSSTSFFNSSKNKTARYQSTEQIIQTSQIPYIGWAFPQGKKKSGDQQFLKLLMKYSDNLQISNTIKEKQSIQNLFESNPQKKRLPKPRLKPRKLNWVKDRYCVNRDKQGDIFEYIIPQISTKQTSMPNLPNFSISLAKKQRK